MKKNDINAKAQPSPVWYPSNAIDLGFLGDDRNKAMKLIAIYQKNTIVHACVDINAKAVTSANPSVLKIVNKGATEKSLRNRNLKRLSAGRAKKISKQWHDRSLNRKSIGDDQELVDASDTEFYQVLDSTDNDLDLHKLLRLTVVSISVYGIGFWQKIRDGAGQQSSYRYLPTYNMLPDRDGFGIIQGWWYSTTFGDGPVTNTYIDKEDVVIFRWPSPTDPHASGDSPLEAAFRKIDLSNKWTDYQDWLISNRARPDAMFIPKVAEGASLNQDQIDTSEKKYNDKFRGRGNGRIAVADGPGTLVPLTFSPTDLAPLKFDEELQKAVLFVLNIPEAFANNDGNRANMEGSLEQWARQSLAPITCMIEAVLNKEAKFFDDSLVFCFESVIPEDEAFELEQDKVELQKWQVGLQYGGLDNNDYRTAVLGLEPLSDDELEARKPKPAPVTVLQQPPAVPAATTEADDDATDPADDAKAFDILAINRAVAKGQIDRATAINVVARFLSVDDDTAKRLVTHQKASQKARAAIRKVKAMPKVKEADHKPLASAVKKNMERQKAHYLAQAESVKFFSELETKDALPKKFTAIESWDHEDGMDYKPYIQVSMDQTADARQKALVQVGAEEDSFSVVPHNVAKAVDQSSMKFAASTNSTTAQDINNALESVRTQIQEGILDGDPLSVIKNRIKDIFEDIDNDRADLIARTETSRAVHTAQQITAKASGVVSGFKFLLSDDSCDICQEYEGDVVGLDEKFDKDNDYDDSILPIHPNCRCTMQEVIDLGDDDDN